MSMAVTIAVNPLVGSSNGTMSICKASSGPIASLDVLGEEAIVCSFCLHAFHALVDVFGYFRCKIWVVYFSFHCCITLVIPGCLLCNPWWASMNESTSCSGSKTCRYLTAPVSPKYCRYSSPSFSMIQDSCVV